jgi:hypothetical protein
MESVPVPKYRDLLDLLNRARVLDQANLKAFRGSLAVRNLHQGSFTTRDGKRYTVDAKGQIRKQRSELK